MREIEGGRKVIMEMGRAYRPILHLQRVYILHFSSHENDTVLISVIHISDLILLSFNFTL